NYKGGQKFQQTIGELRTDAIATLTADEKMALKKTLEIKSVPPAVVYKPRPQVKQWTVAELAPIVENGLKRRDFERGRSLFGEAKCYSCHRFLNEGGAQGPDLTLASGRFNVRDLLESIVEPSK